MRRTQIYILISRYFYEAYQSNFPKNIVWRWCVKDFEVNFNFKIKVPVSPSEGFLLN